MMAAATTVSLSRAAAPASAAPAVATPAVPLLSLCTASFFWTAGGQFQSVRLGGANYVIPDVAMPYLGRGLGLSLFDTGALARAESGGKLAVLVRYSGHVPVLPGVIMTGHSEGVGRGYMTHSGAGRFLSALRRQLLADQASGRYGEDGMFAGGVSLSLAGAPSPAHRPTPDFPMTTLTISGTDLAGKPASNADVMVFNVDDTGRVDALSSFNVLVNGVAKYSVPEGNYFALAEFTDVHGRTAIDQHVVVLPQFSLTRPRTVRVSERAGDSMLTVTAPRPATNVITYARMDRSGTAGQPVEVYWVGTGPGHLFLSPTRTNPSVGTLTETAVGQLTSPAGAAGTPYNYFLAHVSHGTIPRQDFVISSRSLATVHSEFFAGRPSTSGQGAGPISALAIQACEGVFEFQNPLTLPSARITYYSAGQSVPWAQSYNEGVGIGSGGQQEVRVYHAGQQITETWNAYPLHPVPGVVLPGTSAEGPVMAAASRAGNVLRLAWFPFSDSVPGHFGGPFFEGATSINWRVDQNGRRVAGGHFGGFQTINGSFPVQARLSPRPSTVRFTFSAAEPAKLFPLSPASRTIWTWRSQREAGARLPRRWTCTPKFPINGTGPLPPTRSCGVEPLITLEYAVPGLALNGTTPAGQQTLNLTVGHLPLVKPIPVTRASVAVSFNGGKTWHQASITGTAGHYAAVFSATAGAMVTLRTTASDAAGGSFTETITNAYRIATPSRPGVGATGLPAGYRAACPTAGPELAQCFALYAAQVGPDTAIAARAAGKNVPASATRPHGWGARAIAAAYNLPVSRHTSETVALVDAHSTPHLATDLAVYRKQYGLPPCTTASGCLRIVNQAGKHSPLPAADPGGWGVEETLDLSMVSAACPHCKILLVEAKSPAIADLTAAEKTAVRLGATVISNSWGQRESGLTQPFAAAYDRPGHVIVASSGDFGFLPAQFPANLATVTAVGGTELARARNTRGWTEKAWHVPGGATGSGCSAWVTKPRWQHDPHCPGRTVADMSALAWNVAIYDSSIPKNLGIKGPWLMIGGTSAAAPIIAGIYALAGNAHTVRPGFGYRHPHAFFDITKGNNDLINGTNGATCGFDYLCTAKKGYDALTGLGSPDGTAGF
jgi:hypothetical protein